MIQATTDWLKRWWFALSSVALAILYALYQRRGRTITELHFEAQKQLIGQQITAIRDKADQSEEQSNEASQDFENLKRIHADLLQRIGVSPGPHSESDTQ